MPILQKKEMEVQRAGPAQVVGLCPDMFTSLFKFLILKLSTAAIATKLRMETGCESQ
jgi:hypothetical protein